MKRHILIICATVLLFALYPNLRAADGPEPPVTFEYLMECRAAETNRELTWGIDGLAGYLQGLSGRGTARDPLGLINL
jgi:hypothetical protein